MMMARLPDKLDFPRKLKADPNLYGNHTPVIAGGVHTSLSGPTIDTAGAGGDVMAQIFTPSYSKDLVSVSIWVRAATGSPTAQGTVKAVAGIGPTGSNLAIRTTPVSLATGWNEFTFDSALAVTAGTQYAFCSDLQSGTSYTVGFQECVACSGWWAVWTAAVDATIQNSVWHEHFAWAPLLRLEYSDGTVETTILGTAAQSGTSFGIYSNRLSGIGFTPDFTFPLTRIQSFLRGHGTLASAGEGELRIYRAADLQLLRTSANTVLGTAFTAADVAHRKMFDMRADGEPIYCERTVAYYAVLSQVAGGGDSSHHLQVEGSVTSNYATNAPSQAGHNQVHGVYSVSSTNGIANIAADATNGYYMTLFGKGLWG